jgi:FxsC-like protein
MSLVFFSYARVDSDDYLNRFHEDLAGRLARYGGLPKNEAIFRDVSNLEIGDAWPDELTQAISTCKVLICVVTPSYFSRPWCGKEFEFFRRRLARFAEKNKLAGPPPLILPVLWIPEKKGGRRFPEVIKELQTSQGFGDDYARLGLWVLTKLQKYEEAYEDIIHKLAERILEIAQEHDLPPHDQPIELGDMPDPFAPVVPAPAGSSPAAAAPVDRGPRHVQFIVVAGERAEIAQKAGRQNLDAYGAAPQDWRPFLPPRSARIGPILQGIAAEEDFTSDVVDVPKDLVARIEAACKENNLVLLVVDPWSLRIEVCGDQLRQYDQRDFLHCAVLVPWNDADDETKSTREDLQTELRYVFANKADAHDPKRFKDAILSLDQLKDEVRSALIEVRKRILEQAEVARRARSGRVPKPIISAVKVG